jgi:glutaminyl-tRNA synthetase
MEVRKEEKEEGRSLHFIEQIVEEDIRNNKNDGRVHTRFPPEPNGYLHIGHAKSICLNFGLAKKCNGKTNLRFDDTNPSREEQEYVDSIKEDISWLGFSWDEREYYASDYFETLYGYAVKLINKGLAYVCELTAEEISTSRGTPTLPGQPSPYRERTVAENLDLFARMRAGEFAEGTKVLRAKIDMASPNMHMRDPVLYRIMYAHHHRTGDTWCIYPMYDFAHGQCDSLEKITHSICTLEFEVHRPLYEWFIRELEIFPSRQIEFARLNLTYTVMSKRKLLELVNDKHVSGWDDPRMPTISGFRRRGYTPESIREFADRVGVARRENVIELALLEHCLREDLNKLAERRMAVLKPLKVVITNWPEGKVDELDATNNPENPEAGTRKVPFSGELYIEQDDFMEDPPKKYYRLAPGTEVRLRYGYFIRCVDVKKDADGNAVEVHCTYDPETRGGNAPDGRKVQGTIHWVSIAHAVKAETRLYDHLFMKEDPNDVAEGEDWKDFMNMESLKTVDCFVEPSLANVASLEKFQFERIGYFCADPDSTPGKPVFNRTVTLKDSWSKMNAK